MKTENQTGNPNPADFELDHPRPGARLAVLVSLALWAGLVVWLAARGVFVGRTDSPPWALFLGLAIPLTLFVAAWRGWRPFRAYVLGADLRLMTAMQAWRWAGLGFLSLYAQRILPGGFALPAGLGDMAIGISAPWMALALARQPSRAASRRQVIWNLLGVADLVVAVTLGVLCSGFIHGLTRLTGSVTTAPMARLPLVLIPAFLVPFFLMLHLTALLQARAMTRDRQHSMARSGRHAPEAPRL